MIEGMSSNAEPVRGSEPQVSDQPATTGGEKPVPAGDRKLIPADPTSLSSRTGYTWVGLIAGALILIVILVFILQNLDQQPVNFFFWNFSLPIGITVLLSVIAGALVMALVGGVRILQLRRVARKTKK